MQLKIGNFKLLGGDGFVGRINAVPYDMTIYIRTQLSDGVPYPTYRAVEGYEASIVDYEKKIRERIDESKWHYLHIWCGDEIIGQLEFRSFSDFPETGYLHLIYVIEEFRGLGIAKLAQSFIIQTLISNSCKKAMLSVSRKNKRAINHYKHFGWEYLKPNPKHELMDFYVTQLLM